MNISGVSVGEQPCGSLLTCSVPAYPNASYTWTDPNNVTTDGPTVSAGLDGIYQCNASNSQGFATKNVTVNVTESDCPSKCSFVIYSLIDL